MSAPFSDLGRARETLLARGYLRPPPPPAPSRPFLWWVLWTCIMAESGALVAAGSGAGTFSSFAALSLALVPSFAVAGLVGWAGIKALAQRLLAWGHAPQSVARGAATVGALAWLALAVALEGAAGLKLPGFAGVVAGLALGVLIFRWVEGRVAVLCQLPDPGRIQPITLVAFGAATVALAAVTFSWPSRAPWPAEEVLPPLPAPRARLAVVAADGVSREDVEAMAEIVGGGWGLVRAWTWGPLDPSPSRFPAEFWTTVACGTEPARHGVTVFEETRPLGAARGVALSPLAQRLVAFPWEFWGLAPKGVRPTLDRRLPTFWEVAARAGYPVTVVGWWGSWPVRLFPGQVVSERAVLSGAASHDAVTPALAPLVREAFARSSQPGARADRVVLDVTAWASQRSGPQVLALSFVSFDVEARQGPFGSLAPLGRQLPHARAFSTLILMLHEAGFEVFVIGAAWRGGSWFWAFSGSAPARAEVAAVAVAPVILDALGLPRASYHRWPRSWAPAEPTAAVAYGPPPPVVQVPDPEVARRQREVLRSLGYVQ
ncbi:MAG: hypothetical protein ACP5NF_00840 [Thermoanaerobaculum sp.]